MEETEAVRLPGEALHDGTFQMPDLAFKLFVFLLLKASQQDEPTSGTKRRTLRVSFFTIVKGLKGEDGTDELDYVTQTSIVRALAWLEAYGYIERIPGGWQQTITIPDYDRYLVQK